MKPFSKSSVGKNRRRKDTGHHDECSNGSDLEEHRRRVELTVEEDGGRIERLEDWRRKRKGIETG